MEERDIEISASTSDEKQLLKAMGRMFPASEEYSRIKLVCMPADYSASSIARAVEDADATIISLLAYPHDDGMLHVYLCINRLDPSHAVRSLERYGYSVAGASGVEYTDAGLSRQRISELQRYLNI